MKNIKIFSSLLLLAVLFSTACRKKLADRSILSGNEKASVLTVTAPDTLLLMMDKADDEAVSMKWTNTDWGFTPNYTKYDVQIVKANGDWAKANTITNGGLTMAKLSNTELNDIAIAQGIAVNEMGTLTTRIRCYLPDTKLEIFSNTKNMLVKTYKPMKPIITALPIADSIVLLKDSAAVNAMSLSWTPISWNTPSTTVYELQVKVKGDSWDAAMVTPMNAGTSYSIAHKALNIYLLGIIGTDTLGTETLVYRVKASQPGTARVAYSDEVTKAFTTYKMIFVTEKMYLPGDYQGWNHSSTVQILEEVTPGSGNFSGLVEKTKADGSLSNTEFKMTPEADWDYDFGDAGSDYSNLASGSGVIGPKYLGTNGPNFKLVDGTYKITVDTTSSVRTWNYTLENWGVIGDATAGGWGSDQNMRYNQTTKLYEIEMPLTVNSIKLRKNDDWPINLGNPSGNDGDPAPLGTGIAGINNGKNWGIVTAGNYRITLDPVTNEVTITKLP